jgi:hypothetical protein
MQRGEETRQLDISYRHPADHGVLVAGDRAPDAPVKDAEGRPIRLFDLFRGPHATLLSFGETDVPSEPGVEVYRVIRPGDQATGQYVVDVDGHAFAAYAAVDGTTIRVRPDGYLG